MGSGAPENTTYHRMPNTSIKNHSECTSSPTTSNSCAEIKCPRKTLTLAAMNGSSRHSYSTRAIIRASSKV